MIKPMKKADFQAWIATIKDSDQVVVIDGATGLPIDSIVWRDIRPPTKFEPWLRVRAAGRSTWRYQSFSAKTGKEINLPAENRDRAYLVKPSDETAQGALKKHVLRSVNGHLQAATQGFSRRKEKFGSACSMEELNQLDALLQKFMRVGE